MRLVIVCKPLMSWWLLSLSPCHTKIEQRSALSCWPRRPCREWPCFTLRLNHSAFRTSTCFSEVHFTTGRSQFNQSTVGVTEKTWWHLADFFFQRKVVFSAMDLASLMNRKPNAKPGSKRSGKGTAAPKMAAAPKKTLKHTLKKPAGVMKKPAAGCAGPSPAVPKPEELALILSCNMLESPRQRCCNMFLIFRAWLLEGQHVVLGLQNWAPIRCLRTLNSSRS